MSINICRMPKSEMGMFECKHHKTKRFAKYPRQWLSILAVCCYVWMQSAVAAEQKLWVSNLTLEEGLSQNTIICMAQDPTGFIWFGTQDGLNRYDGYTFKIYRPQEGNDRSISSNGIRATYVDRQGILWVGTYVGLNRYDRQHDNFVRYVHNPDDPHSLGHNHVRAITEDRYGMLWLGTQGGGVNMFNPQSGAFKHYRAGDGSGLGNDMVNTLYVDQQGILWVGTNAGLYRYNRERNDFTAFVAQSDRAGVLGHNIINVIYEDRHGLLWLGTEGGLYRMDRQNDTFSAYRHDAQNTSSLSDDRVVTLLEDGTGAFWVGTDGGGLNRFERKHERFVRIGNSADDDTAITDARISALLEDRAGLIWIGTYGGGISIYNRYNFFSTIQHNDSPYGSQHDNRYIRGFLVDSQGGLWVGSEGGGINYTGPDGRKKYYIHDPANPNSLSSNRIFSIFEDRQGIIWAGGMNGALDKFDPKRQRFTRYSSGATAVGTVKHGNMRVIYEDSQGLLWVANDGGGLHIFDRAKETFKHYHNDSDDPASLSNNRIFALYEDHQNEIWVGTFGGGLNKYDRINDNFKHYRHNADNPGSLSYDNVLSIYEDAEHLLWIGTDGGGLNRFDRTTQQFKRYGEEAGLPNNTIYGILSDDLGNLWLSHNSGLSRFNPKTGEIKNYDVRDGMQSNEFNGGAYYKSADGRLFFGGINGYNAFRADRIYDNPHPPPVVITDFQLFNKSVSVGEAYNNRRILSASIMETPALTLSHKDYVFSLEFSALNYASPERNQYAYKMEGLEDTWNYVGNRRFVTYTTLPPGEYNFHVKAANNHGVWNEVGTQLAITVTPPFWQTWWFRVIALLIILMLISAFYGWRVKNIRERNKMLQHEVKARTAELEAQKTELEATLVELGETKDALVEAAHKAGMADTATGVLHNIGNILNSANTSAGVIRERLQQPVLSRFTKANELLKTNMGNIVDFITHNPKGVKLLQYYLELEKSMFEENGELRENADRLMEKMIAIKEAVSAQQRYAKGGSAGFYDELPLDELIEDTMLLQTASIGRHEIKVRKIFNEVPPVRVQKTKVVQILTNLYKNAKESMDEANPKEKILTIELSRDEEYAYIKVSDTGLGIAKEKLEGVFAYGFTTKANGHGFGLHSCANYMSEMGGKMWAESEGTGKGATFILRFPLEHKTDSAAEAA